MTTPDDKPPRITPPPVGPRPTPLAVASIVSLLTAVGLGGLNLLAPGKASDVPGIFGTVSSWISAGGIMGILSLLVWLQLGTRKIKVEQQLADNADAADVRDTYAEMVEGLRRERTEQAEAHRRELADIEARYSRNIAIAESHYQQALKTAEDRHQAALAAAEQRHESCEAERQKLAGKVRCLEQKVQGLEDQLRTQASDRVIALESRGEEPSELVADAARRVKKIVEDKGGNGGGGDSSPGA